MPLRNRWIFQRYALFEDFFLKNTESNFQWDVNEIAPEFHQTEDNRVEFRNQSYKFWRTWGEGMRTNCIWFPRIYLIRNHRFWGSGGCRRVPSSARGHPTVWRLCGNMNRKERTAWFIWSTWLTTSSTDHSDARASTSSFNGFRSPLLASPSHGTLATAFSVKKCNGFLEPTFASASPMRNVRDCAKRNKGDYFQPRGTGTRPHRELQRLKWKHLPRSTR